MPGIVRKLLIFAAVDGLVLQPVASPRSQNSQRHTTAPLKISYNPPHLISPTISDESHRSRPGSSSGEVASGAYLEAYGIVGLLKICDFAYLLTVSRRTQVAQIWGKPVYAITGISIVPLSSQIEAQQAIEEERARALRHERREQKASKPGEDTATDEDTESESDAEAPSDSGRHGRRSSSGSISTMPGDDAHSPPATSSGTRIVEEVFKKKDAFGNATNRWLSSKNWGLGRSKNKSIVDEGHGVATGVEAIKRGDHDNEIEHPHPSRTPMDFASMRNAVKDGGKSPAQGQYTLQVPSSTIHKILQTTRLLFNSRTFFFSYETDLTHRLSSRDTGKTSDMPLFQQADPKYFWNQHITEPFMGDGATDYIIPVMQGFVGQRLFTVTGSVSGPSPSQPTVEVSATSVTHSENDTLPETTSAVTHTTGNQQESFLLTLISRRSINRAGLRYLRRGLDSHGNTANSNETEQILSTPDWISRPVYSFVQVRGSIPVFFNQTPYSFKPVPVLTGSEASNDSAIRKHFSDLSTRYGKVHSISLVNRHGGETVIGESYERRLQHLNDQGGVGGNNVGFEWFDFHKVCRGMKFENVLQLVDSTASFLDTCGWTTWNPRPDPSTTKHPFPSSTPPSTQTGITRTNCMDCLDRTNVVQSAFAQRTLTSQLSTFSHTIDLRSDPSTAWFNTLWADNGDAISRAYAGTSALKGDFTRTRKRSPLGALTDLSLTLSRYKHNIFEDFFAQIVIDYLLGGVTENVFVEYEDNLVTIDPGVDVGKVRQEAVTTAAERVVEDEDEVFVGGWVVATPAVAGTLRSLPMEEAVLLLTDRALYAVRFEWATGKVRAFERVELSCVGAITWGAYVTEVNTERQRDERVNVGFVVDYASSGADGEGDSARVNMRSLDSSTAARKGNDNNLAANESKTKTNKFLAFKALPSRSSIIPPSTSSSSNSNNRPNANANILTQAQTEKDTVREICKEIYVAAAKVKTSQTYEGHRMHSDDGGDGDTNVLTVKEAPIISAEAAERNAGYLERIGYGIRKYVWG